MRFPAELFSRPLCWLELSPSHIPAALVAATRPIALTGHPHSSWLALFTRGFSWLFIHQAGKRLA
jgi:hypothetical protein